MKHSKDLANIKSKIAKFLDATQIYNKMKSKYKVEKKKLVERAKFCQNNLCQTRKAHTGKCNFLKCHNCRDIVDFRRFPINTLRLCDKCTQPEPPTSTIKKNKFSHHIGKRVATKNSHPCLDKKPYRFYGIIISSNNSSFRIEWKAAFDDICYKKKGVAVIDKFEDYNSLDELTILNNKD